MLLSCGTLGRIAAETVFLATGKHEVRGVSRSVAAPAWWA